MTEHLTVRVPWHDERWNGRICQAPSRNTFCLDLKRIRLERNDDAQDKVAGRGMWELSPEEQPPCKAESGMFMNDHEWRRRFEHPYQDHPKLKDRHGKLKPTFVKVPPYSTFAVPFNWMLRGSQEDIEESVPQPLPPDDEPPFPSPWVFAPERQEALCELVFSRITPKESLVFFYTKGGHPLDETILRLVVGVGRIEWMSKLLRYESEASFTYPFWDRLFTHSIRPTSTGGFLLPYHDYLNPTGIPAEDARRRELVNEIAVVPDPAQTMAYSYAGEIATPDVALSSLVRCLEAVRLIRSHGVSVGPWDQREDWLNAEIAKAWKDRGAFPGAGAILEALGMRLGTSLVRELIVNRTIGSLDDPWPVLDGVLKGSVKPPQRAYDADLEAVRATWSQLPQSRLTLVKLLSRFDLTTSQAARWLDPKERNKATRSPISDEAIIDNPYRMSEADLGDWDDHPISVGVIDRGLMPDATVAAKHPVPPPSCVDSPLNWRRVRAALVSVLRSAAENGDTLLSRVEAMTRLGKLDLARPCVVPTDWFTGNAERLEGEIKPLDIPSGEGGESAVACLQLSELEGRERKLASTIAARAGKVLPSLGEDWRSLLAKAVKQAGGIVDPNSERHSRALTEQADALERVTTRRVSALVGRAGTGKTTVLGALLESTVLRNDGILFLAPTGKARVQITKRANQPAMTIAQFLNQLGRYDGARQLPRFSGKEQYRKEKTIVIDECSMLTLDDLVAVLVALDLAHVQRLILVGDPNQLPPIGVGRPFADIVAWFDAAQEAGKLTSGGLARLTIELRTAAGAPSDALRLASWYTREPQPVDADRVLSDLELGSNFNDLTIAFWSTPAELRERLEEQFVTRLGLKSGLDVEGFNLALGLEKQGWVPFGDHNGAEKFQILSPVRMHPYGVHELNRTIQRRFRGAQLKSGREPWGLVLGEEEIVWGDKVILNRNGCRDGWDGKKKEKVEEYLANGEVGLAGQGFGNAKNKLLNVAFAGRPDVRFGFFPSSFSTEGGPLELAYALTVHKSQGSEFGTVFVVIPRQCRLLTRELLYTALTRARQHLVLLVEGEDPSFLYDLTRPEQSETARRNTNLFTAGIRTEDGSVPYAEHLVHRTTRGELVRSKSELVIANHLHSLGLPYIYERPFDGTAAAGKLRPDFSFVDPAGDVIIWEHLGMLSRDDYRKSWEWKRAWYSANGFEEDKNLFTTSEGPGLDMNRVADAARKVAAALDT